MLIDGRWVAAADEATWSHLHPATGEQVASFPVAGPAGHVRVRLTGMEAERLKAERDRLELLRAIHDAHTALSKRGN